MALRLHQHRVEVLALGAGINLRLGRVHEVIGDAADMFAVLAAAMMEGPIVWIGNRHEVGSLAPTGLQMFLDPSRLILTETLSRQETLWASEQALRLKGASSVIAELGNGPDLKESRRLQIAAEEGGSLGLVLIRTHAQSSAAETRWESHALAGESPAWIWRLTKSKSGQSGTWGVQWKEDAHAPDFIPVAAAASA